MENRFEKIIQGILFVLLVIGIAILGFLIWKSVTTAPMSTVSQNENTETGTTMESNNNENQEDNGSSSGVTMTNNYVVANDPQVCDTLEGAVKNTCVDYYATLRAFEPKAQQLKKSFYYNMKKVEVTFEDGSTKEFVVEVADNDEKRFQGLSYRETMDQDQGMLFTFDGKPASSFHMKDMLFSLDIVFFDAEGNVTDDYQGLPSCVPSQDGCPIEHNTTGKAMKVLEILPQGKKAVKLQEM